MNTQEDLYCAEHVLGWPIVKSVNDAPETAEGCIREDHILKKAGRLLWLAWAPSSSANDDCDILAFVNKNWPADMQASMSHKLRLTYESRSKFTNLAYKEGDYCKAAAWCHACARQAAAEQAALDARKRGKSKAKDESLPADA